MNINDLKKDRNFHIKQELKKYLSDNLSKLILSFNEDEVENVVYVYSCSSFNYKSNRMSSKTSVFNNYEKAEKFFIKNVNEWLEYYSLDDNPCLVCPICVNKKHHCGDCEDLDEEDLGKCTYSLSDESVFCCDTCNWIV
jgi:hypothetical protein